MQLVRCAKMLKTDSLQLKLLVVVLDARDVQEWVVPVYTPAASSIYECVMRKRTAAQDFWRKPG